MYEVEPDTVCEPLSGSAVPGDGLKFCDVDQFRVTGLVPSVVIVTTKAAVPVSPAKFGEPGLMLMPVTRLPVQERASEIGMLTATGAVMSRVSVPAKGLADGVHWSVTSTVCPAATLTVAGAVALPFDRSHWYVTTAAWAAVMAPVTVKPGMAVPHGNVAGETGELVTVAFRPAGAVVQVRLNAALSDVTVTGLVTTRWPVRLGSGAIGDQIGGCGRQAR